MLAQMMRGHSGGGEFGLEPARERIVERDHFALETRPVEAGGERDRGALRAGALERRQHFQHADLHDSRRGGRHAPAHPVVIIAMINQVGL